MPVRRSASASSSLRSFLPGLLAASTLALSFGLGACQADEAEKSAVAPPVGSAGSSGKGGSGSGAKGGTGGSGENGGSGGTEAVGGSSSGDPCDGKEADLVRINNAAAADPIAKNTKVKIKGIVATSHKFLASAKTCLWAFTATTAGDETIEYGSIQVVAKGKPALIKDDGTTGDCPLAEAGGPIPDDLKPGDIVDLTAYADEFVATTCNAAPNTPPSLGQRQLQVNTTNIPDSCFTRTPGDAVPAPHVFATTEEMTAFAAGTNADDINAKWGAALITLQGPIKPKQSDKTDDYPTTDSAVSKYGDMLLTGTSLAVNNNVLYQDVTGTGPKDSKKRTSWPLTTEFSSITGVGVIDFCTWSLSLRSQCGDATPNPTECK